LGGVDGAGEDPLAGLQVITGCGRGPIDGQDAEIYRAARDLFEAEGRSASR
jgi:hypothetical protein